MISLRGAKNYCCDVISLIENYYKAIYDAVQTWDCHHRLEIELNLSRAELKEKDLYYNRPASELIFLTHNEHQQIHKLHKNYMRGRTGELHHNYGKPRSEETKRKLSETKIEYYKTHDAPIKGKHQSEESNKKKIKSTNRIL